SLRVQHSSLTQPKIQRSDEHAYLFVVADGMGGHRGGEYASSLTLETIEAFVLNDLTRLIPLRESNEEEILGEFGRALCQVDAKLFEAAHQRPELCGMGTTVTLAYNLGSVLYVVHAGDSRCYLLRGRELRRLTHDHTLVEQLARQGLIKSEEMCSHP